MIGSIHSRDFDSDVDITPCNAQTNANLTLHVRVFLNQVNPAGATGTHPDHDGTLFPIVRWSAGEWAHFCHRYQQITQDFWTGRAWLGTPDRYSEMDWPAAAPTVKPNVFCRLRVSVAASPAGAHKRIDVVHLADGAGRFRSNDGLYSQRDIRPERQNGISQITATHEMGHLLTLGHSGQNRAACLPGNTNANVCYGQNGAGGILNRADYSDAMGGGHDHRGWHAEPWQIAIQRHTGISRWEWAVSRVRIYPRQLSDLHHVHFGRARA